MDKRLYPSGQSLVPTRDIETSPTASDYIETIRSSIKQKWISLTNLFASPPPIGSTTPAPITATYLKIAETEYTASGAIDANVSVAALNKTSKIEMTIAAPAAGRFLIIYQKDAGTAGHTVTLTAGTFDGSHTIATFNAQDKCLVLFGISATRFVIVANIGTVALT